MKHKTENAIKLLRFHSLNDIGSVFIAMCVVVHQNIYIYVLLNQFEKKKTKSNKTLEPAAG